MEFVSAFDEASRDVEAEVQERAHTAATQEATACWPFLALAKSEAEFGHRLALVEDRLTSIASKHGVSLDEIVEPLKRGFAALQEAQEAVRPFPGKTAAEGSSYEEKGLHGVVGTPDRNEDGTPMRFQCPTCVDGSGGWFDLDKGYQQCPNCQGSGSVHRTPKVENPVHKADYVFTPAKRHASKTAAEGDQFHRGPSIDDPTDGPTYTEAPQWVSNAARRRFEGGGVAVIHPDKPDHYLHNVRDWVNGAREIKHVGNGDLEYTNPYTRETDRFNEHGYYGKDGTHHTWASSYSDMTPHEGSAKTGRWVPPSMVDEGDQVSQEHNGESKPGYVWVEDGGLPMMASFDQRLAAIKQALEEGVDPLALITEISGGQGAPATPTHHMTTQVFEGDNPVAYDAAMAEGQGSAQPENAGGHSLKPQASREAHPFA